MRLTLHQMNPTVGDVPGNAAKVAAGLDKARKLGSDLAIFPECALTGYPAEDLLFVPSFIDANMKALNELAPATAGLTAVVGFVHREGELYNSAAVFSDGQLVKVVHKTLLPNYSVFDEERYFNPGPAPVVFALGDATIGVTICEDIWHEHGPARAQAAEGGADLIVNISASPYHKGKADEREAMLAGRAKDNGVFIAFCNTVGGQDELVFDGNSVLLSPTGAVVARGLPFEEDVVVADVDTGGKPEGQMEKIALTPPAGGDKPELVEREVILHETEEEEVYRALVLGVRDYTRKNGFTGVLLGLSGGIDSALTASIAVDALGADKVMGVTMPSRYSSRGSVDDSLELAANMGIEYKTIPIEGPFAAFLEALGPHFEGREPDVAEENIQARVRGTILMALSNKFGKLLLTTGNKSETSVGYCTLYGDMAGGFAVIKDVPKLLVYSLSRWRNDHAHKPWIPVDTITKPPSAELRPDQKDSDSLPDYEVLDPILNALVEGNGVLDGLDERYGEQNVTRAARLVDLNEYKRRQAPPGVRITTRAFGKDRRFPITNRFKRRS